MAWLVRYALAAGCIVNVHAAAHAQSLSVASQRPFVVGVIPVVGRSGAVGGVAIDASGAISNADVRGAAVLRTARRAAVDGRVAAGDGAAGVARPSKLRKIALRRLDALLAEHATHNSPLPPEVLNLAGLQRVEYLFAYPEERDVVLAGPAGAWTIDDAGQAVGQNSAAAVLQLVDLIAALRSTDALRAGEPISCSIDPTPAGLQQLARLSREVREAPSARLLNQMEEAVGQQSITLTGIPPASHFAHILVAADWRMKRLAMGLDRSPVDGLVSYLDLLQEHPGVTPQNAMPRWWIAYGREPVQRDREGLGWRLSPPGLEIRTAAGRLDASGKIAASDQRDSLAEQWAAAMTARYDELAIHKPVFGQLRGCMDLALVAAVMASGDLRTRVGIKLPMLLDPRRLALAPHPVPKTVASESSAVRRRREWIVTVSGGVDLDVAGPVNDAAVQPMVEQARRRAAPNDGGSWWWD